MNMEQKMDDQIEGSLNHQKEEYELIEEYQKASAEVLGFGKRFGYYGTSYKRHVYTKGREQQFICDIADWQPNKDANQMLMVWEWLRKQKDVYQDLFDAIFNYFLRGGDIKLATMKAFMQYIKF